MTSADFLADMRRMARTNGVWLKKEQLLLDMMYDDIEDDGYFVNIVAGSNKGNLLLITSHATYAVRPGFLSPQLDWRVPHEQLREARAGRRVMRGYVNDFVEVETLDGDTHDFWVGFFDPRQSVQLGIAQSNVEVAITEIQVAAKARTQPAPSGTGDVFTFDPEGPEKAGAQGKRAYTEMKWVEAFRLYVKAIDRLHDFYVFERFRNRQPSPADAWLVEGMTASLGCLRQQEPSADVREDVRTVTHRLRTIMTATEGAGGNAVLYRRALDELAELAPDIDVSDILWT